jgi:hypothetical protein
MAYIPSIRIITELGELTIQDSESLGIVFNRIADDLTDLSTKYSDFSYDFEIPIVDSNNTIFSYASVEGNRRIFRKNQNIPCKVYLNDALLLDGLINLISINNTSYSCVLYSKYKDFVDGVGETLLRDLEIEEIPLWEYEESMVQHMLTEGISGNSDSTTYQFPLCKYSTYFTPYSIYSGSTDNRGHTILADESYQNFYYLFNNKGSSNNRMFIHQFPPSIYLVSVVEAVLRRGGYKLGGQFFNLENTKKIILTYAGDEDIYDQATGAISGSTGVTLQIGRFLPDTKCIDFINDILSTFNLYFDVDINNKIIRFNTWQSLFGDVFDPYDITKNVDKTTIEYSQVETNNPTIMFKESNNLNIMGDNYVVDDTSNNAYTQSWTKVSNVMFDNTFNRIGDETSDEIEVGFAAPTIQRTRIWNDTNRYGVVHAATDHVIYLPCLTAQSPTDNDNKKFNKATGDTYLFNTEDTIKFKGDWTLMYYYGISTSSFENKTGKGSIADYMYINIYVNNVLYRVPIGIASPFQLFNYRDEIDNWLGSLTIAKYSDRRTIIASYLQSIWQLMGTNSGAPTDKLTDYSLVFDDNNYFHKTLWSEMHSKKYDRYRNGKLLTATMRMNVTDWNEMKLGRPVKYSKTIYHIVSIEDYNPISNVATINLIEAV